MECTSDRKSEYIQLIYKEEHAGVAIYGWKLHDRVILVSMGPLAEWGPGQIAPVAPPLSAALSIGTPQPTLE